MHDGYQAVLDAFARGLEPDPSLPVDEWAEEFQVVPKESGAAEPGPYRTDRTPHARQPMRCLSAGHPCKRVVLMGASQVFKTQVGLNFLGETICQRPKNFLWIVPTGKLQSRAAARIDKNVAAVPQLRERVAKPKSRDAANSRDIKEFRGGALYIATAGAAANLAELSVCYVVFDEIDRALENVGGEGDPRELAETRQTRHERDRKTYYPSSPTIEDESAIQTLYDLGTQQVAEAECIHCGRVQPLDFFRLIRSEDGRRALYPCCACGGLHEEGDKPRMFARGLWSEGVIGDGETESFQISAMFLPYGALPWVALMRQYDSAKAKLEAGSEEAMIAFYNTRLALCWARTKEATSHEELQDRAGGYRVGEVPAGALVLTASIDTQAHRLELLIVGWGEGLECWVIDYQVVHGSPAEAETWERADALLRDRYRHASGNMLPISAAFVDSGGSNTQDVYTYTAALKRRKVFPVKGHSRPNKPIISGKPTQAIIDSKGKSVRKAASLWMIGTDTAKDYLHARWKRKTGAGAIHFPEGLPESFYKGLTAEYRASGYKRGRKVSWWEQKTGEANEPLDLMVYNLAAAHYLQLHKHSEQRWKALRDRLATVDGAPALAVVRQADADVERPQDAPAVTPPRAEEPPRAPAPTRVISGGKISLAAFRRRFS